jgi:large subunit ribosomal protein L6
LLFNLKMKNTFKTNFKIPANVKLRSNENVLEVSGHFGSIYLNTLFFTTKNISFLKKKQLSSTFFRSLQNAIVGVNLGFASRLTFVGVGFRVEAIEKNFIKLKLGFSHFVFIKIPSYIKVFSPKKTLLVLRSIDKQLLKEFSCKICSFKLPDIYKGKGILYKNQKLQLKAGKKKK